MILKILNSITNFVVDTFTAIYKIGGFIVRVVTFVGGAVTAIICNLFFLVNVLFEDFYVFAEDLRNKIAYGAEIIGRLTADISNGLGVLSNQCQTAFRYVNVLNLNFAAKIGVFVSNAAIFLKDAIILIGSSVYLIISLPIHSIGQLPNLVRFVHSQYRQSIDFVSKTPTDALIGSATIILVGYLLHQYYRSIIKLCFESYNRIRRYFSYRKKKNDAKVAIPNQQCIICEERVKCIVTLPCRHLCLCHECCVKLPRYNNSCPICRRSIDKTIMVYL